MTDSRSVPDRDRGDQLRVPVRNVGEQQRVEGPRSRPPGVTRLAWLLPLIAVLALVGYAGVRKQQPQSIAVQLARGQRPAAPDFRLARLDGGTLRLSALRGQAVVLNFWASWCVPCKDEAPLLERAWQAYRTRGLVVVGVNIQDLDLEARKFVVLTRTTFVNVRDADGAVSRDYGLTGVPETFFIDREGRIVRKFPGAALQWAQWETALEDLLKR